MYSILLYQTSQEIQTVYTVESYEEAMKLFMYECASLDEYTEFDDELILYKGDEVLAYHKITDEQRG